MKTEFEIDQFELAYPLGVERHYWQRARVDVLADYLRKLGENKFIAEVGCGRGVVTMQLRKRGFKVYGVELAAVDPDPSVRAFVNTGIDAVDMPIDFRSKVDVLMFLDVIEHIEKPDEFISLILSAYPNVSSVIITVPARQELWSNYDEFYGHYKRYSTEDLEGLAVCLGLRLKMHSYFFHGLYLPAAISTLLFKHRNVRVTSPKGWKSKLHAFIGKMFYLDFKIMPAKLVGTSAICVLEKSK